MSLLRGTVWNALAAIVLSAGRMLLAAMVVRRLGAETFGAFSFAQWLVDISYLSIAFGLPAIGTRYFAHYEAAGKSSLLEFSGWYSVRAWWVAGGAAIAVPALLLLESQGSLEELLGVSGWAFFSTAWALAMARLQGLQRYRQLFISNCAYAILVLGGTTLLPAGAGLGLISAVMAMASAGAWVICGMGASGRSLVDRKKLNLVGLRKYAINMWITGLVSTLVWTRGELLVVKLNVSLEGVGLYSAALGITGLAGIAMNLLTGALMPRFAQLEAEHRHGEATALCRTVTDVLLATGTIGVAFLALWAAPVTRLFYGDGLGQVAQLLPWLAVSALALAGNALNGLLQLLSDGRFTRNLNVFGVIGLFALAVPLVGSFGLPGAVGARVGTQLGVLAWMLISAARVDATLVNWRNVAGCILVVIAVCVLVGSVEHVPRLVLSVAVVLAVVVFFRIGAEGKSVIPWLWEQWSMIRGRS